METESIPVLYGAETGGGDPVLFESIMIEHENLNNAGRRNTECCAKTGHRRHLKSYVFADVFAASLPIAIGGKALDLQRERSGHDAL